VRINNVAVLFAMFWFNPIVTAVFCHFVTPVVIDI